MGSEILPVVSQCRVYPRDKSTMGDLKLSVSDVPLLTCHYNQKGSLFSSPPYPTSELLARLKSALSLVLTHFPPLAGQLTVDENGVIKVTCNDFGVDFVHVDGSRLCIADLVASDGGDVPELVKECFPMNGVMNYEGRFRPLLAVQVTDLADGVFIGCTMNHALADGTSFWNFFNSFAELCRGVKRITGVPDFSRDSILVSPVFPEFLPGVLGLPPFANSSNYAAIREKVFKFTRESILRLKAQANKTTASANVAGINVKPPVNISSFQSLCSLLWRGITRARKLPPHKTTTFRLAINYRHRINPNLDSLYFGNGILSTPITSTAGDILNNDICGCAMIIHEVVEAQDDAAMRKYVANWERRPEYLSPGNMEGEKIVMGSSPRFPMYENDFGWGKPITVRSGPANKFDGKITAFPGSEGDGGVEFEVVLAAETMTGLESDPEFTHFASAY